MIVSEISPLGVRLLLASDRCSLSKGQSVDLDLTLGNDTHRFSGVVVDRVDTLSRDLAVTVRLVEPTSPRPANAERRNGLRWLCSEQFFPTAIAANPARYNDFVYLKFRDLSRSGARVVTSLRNKFIVRGMRLECLVSFPLVSQIRMELIVRNVSVAHEQGKDLLSLGVEFLASDSRDLNVIAQYLLQFGDTESLESLRQSGLIPSSMGKASIFFVRTQEEYEQVLSLRTGAYGDAGKLPQGSQPEYMADAYDAKSKIIVGKYRGKVVSSARMYFPEYGDVFEQEEFVSWPLTLGRRDEAVEVMRVCTHQDFRRSDLLFSLLRFMAVTAIQAKRYKIVGCATDNLLPLYEKVGLKNTGLSYELPALNNIRHWMIVGDARRCVLGTDVGPILWNVLWSDTADYLVENQLLNLDLLTKIRLIIYRAMGPLAHVLRRRAQKPRRRN